MQYNVLDLEDRHKVLSLEAEDNPSALSNARLYLVTDDNHAFGVYSEDNLFVGIVP